MTERELQLKPPPRRDVRGFEVEPGEDEGHVVVDLPTQAGSTEGGQDAEPESPSKPKERTRRKPRPVQKEREVKDESGSRMRIHATVTPVVGQALRDRAKKTGESNTDVLIGSFVDHIERLRADRGEGVDDKLVKAGFAPRSRRRTVGRMEVTFFLAPDEIAIFDKEVESLSFGSRSELFDTLLEHELSATAATVA